MIKAIVAAWLGSTLIGAVVYQSWLDAVARFMGEDVIFNAASAFLFVYPVALIYTGVVGIPLGLATYWLLKKTDQQSLWAYLFAGLVVSVALAALREPYGVGRVLQTGSDGLGLTIVAVGVSAGLIFWMIHVRRSRNENV